MAKRKYYVFEDLDDPRTVVKVLQQLGVKTLEDLYVLAVKKSQAGFDLRAVLVDYAHVYEVNLFNEGLYRPTIISFLILAHQFKGFYPICISGDTGEVDVEQTLEWIQRPQHTSIKRLEVGEKVFYLAAVGESLRFLGNRTKMAKMKNFLVKHFDLDKIEKICLDMEITIGLRYLNGSVMPRLTVEEVLKYVGDDAVSCRQRFVIQVRKLWPEQAHKVPDWR